MMKVKIAYTVDLDDIPSEVDRLYEKVKPDLENVVESVVKFGKSNDASIDEKIKGIETLRRNMGAVDVLLADVHMILLGYMNVLSNPNGAEGDQQELVNEEHAH